jgi:hypothetical protein
MRQKVDKYGLRINALEIRLKSLTAEFAEKNFSSVSTPIIHSALFAISAVRFSFDGFSTRFLSMSHDCRKESVGGSLVRKKREKERRRVNMNALLLQNLRS